MLIFIAYSSKDQSLVEDLIVELGVLGYNVQFEQKLVGGMLRWEQIFESIVQCDIFIFMVTSNTLASYSRRTELDYALALDKPILAVRFQEADLSTLPSEIIHLVDYSARDQALRTGLVQALSALPISAPSNKEVAPPNLSYSISQVRKRIDAPDKNDAEKDAILLNLQELLERRETYLAAESLLDWFAPQVNSNDRIAREFKATRARIKRNNSSSRRSFAVLLGALLLIFGVLLILFVRGTLPFNLNRSSTPPIQIAAVLATATPTNLRAEASAQAFALLPSATATFTTSPTPLPSATATPLPSATPTFTPSPTPLPSATATFTPSPTPLPSATATPLPSATLTFTPSPTPLPSATPTFTPSSTPLPSATATFTPSPIPLPSATPTFTPSPTPLPSATATFTASPTPLPTATATFTSSPTPLPTATPTHTPTVDLGALVPNTVYVGIMVEDTAQGVQVVKVGASAATAGVQVGDDVLAVDLDDVTTSAAFYQEMNARNPFARANLRLRRNGNIVFAIITLGIEDYTIASTPTIQR